MHSVNKNSVDIAATAAAAGCALANMNSTGHGNTRTYKKLSTDTACIASNLLHVFIMRHIQPKLAFFI